MPGETRDIKALEAAKLYYEQSLTQSNVAERLGVSRPTVAKLLQLARDKGYVTIQIHDPRDTSSVLGTELQQKFHLQDVRVVHPVSRDQTISTLAPAGAQLISSLIFDGANVGISWGNTMYAVAKALTNVAVHDVTVVQLKGGHSHSERSTNDFETLNLFREAFNATTLNLPLPVIFDSPEVKELVVKDRHISEILRAGREVDIAIFTVGDVHRESLLMNLGYLSKEETDILLEKAVGDACSRFFAADGTMAYPPVDARTVGISLRELASRPTRVLIAGGIEKAVAIRVALEMGLATHLVIDDETASRVVRETAG